MVEHTSSRRSVLLGGVGLATAGLAATLGGPIGARAAGGSARGKRVEYIAFGLQFEYQVAMVANVKKRAQESGIVLHVIDGKGDPNLQVTEVLDAVAKSPDAMLINPVDAKLLVAGVKRANEAKIPVFIMENAPPEGKYLGFVDFDNVAGGRMGADELAKLVGGSGTVLETRGSVGSDEAQKRHQGFIEQMAKHPGIKVKSLNTEWVADKAYKMVLDAFTEDPHIKGVFSHNDEMVRGIVSAPRQIGKLVPAGKPEHVAIVGLDGTPLALDRIRKGIQDASVGQDPVGMGNIIFNDIIAYFEGKSFNANGKTEPILITQANVNDPRLWGNFGRKA